MKKNRLENIYEVDFELFGLVCNKKEYKLAWYLNEALKINLVKQEDIKMEFSDGTSIAISNYRYETNYVTLELLQNKLVASSHAKYKYLVQELSQFDYLLKFKDEAEEMSSENVSVSIKEIPVIEYAMKLNFDLLKSKENLLY